MFASFTASRRLQLPHYILILQALESQGVGFEFYSMLRIIIVPRDTMVVLEKNNEHLTRLLAEGLSLFRALLSPRQGVVLESCPEAAPGEPGAAAVQSVRPSAG